jgi:superfamily II DNA or RNA helicase
VKHGVVATYHQVAANPELWRKHSSVSTLVIFDEIHHSGDESTWGQCMKYAFGDARRRLMLSGTPFRTDNSPIPFVEYDDDGLSKSHAGISMREAVIAGVIRSVTFQSVDGIGSWMNHSTGATYSERLSETDAFNRGNTWAAMREPSNDWIATAFVKADQELSRVRQTMPKAGGIVYAASIHHVKKYAKIMADICGESVEIVHSELDDSNQVIKRFANGSSRWLISIRMVSEGVDIPRAIVGVYASDISTEMWFRQVVGRHVRKMNGDEGQDALLFIPKHPELCEIAYRVQEEANVPLKDREPFYERDAVPSSDRPMSDIETLWASPAEFSEVIHDGSLISVEELRRADEMLRRANNTLLRPAALAHILRVNKIEGGPLMVLESQTVEQPTRTPDQERKHLRKRIEGLVNRAANVTGFEQKEINHRLARHFKVRRSEADIDCLKSQIEYLKELIAAGREQTGSDELWV